MSYHAVRTKIIQQEEAQDQRCSGPALHLGHMREGPYFNNDCFIISHAIVSAKKMLLIPPIFSVNFGWPVENQCSRLDA